MPIARAPSDFGAGVVAPLTWVCAIHNKLVGKGRTERTLTHMIIGSFAITIVVAGFSYPSAILPVIGSERIDVVVRDRELCRGKGLGTRACYDCCRTHGLSASRCLRNCRIG